MFLELYVFSVIVVLGYIIFDWDHFTANEKSTKQAVSITFLTLMIAPLTIGLILGSIAMDTRQKVPES